MHLVSFPMTILLTSSAMPRWFPSNLIIRDLEGNVLLGLRENEPAKNTYFVPGGVIRKNETIREAFTRILNAEMGLTASFDEATLVGAFEHFYKTNRFGHPDYGTHYVVLAYGVSLKAQQAVAIDSQHSDVQWMSEDQINSATNSSEYKRLLLRGRF
jgi:colanic acid biosynthesis protein WcaH